MIRKILSQKVNMKFLPKLIFRKDESFEYAEKIENLIKQTNKQEYKNEQKNTRISNS